MNFDSDLRAPLELTKASVKTATFVCPNCRYSRTLSVSTVGVICSNCNKYFSTKDALPDSEAIGAINTSKTIDTEFTKRKADMEKKAYEWRDQQEKSGKLGKISHEPDGAQRKW